MAYRKQHYETFEQGIEALKDARDYQTKAWPSTQLEDCGQRTFEDQLLLVEQYTLKLRAVWNETASYIDDGNTPNIEGRKRVKKYAAIVANAALWAAQAALGEEVVLEEKDIDVYAAIGRILGCTREEAKARVLAEAFAAAPQQSDNAQ